MDGVFLLLVCCSPVQEIDCAIICFFGIIREMIINNFVEDDLQKPKLLHETKHARCCGSIQRNVVSSFELNLFMMNVQVI